MRPDDLLDGGKRKMPTKPKGSRKQPRKSPATESPQTEMVPVKPVPREWDQMEDREMCLSVVNKANQMTLSEDKLSVTSWKGYRTVRATRGVVEGAWYFEVEAQHLGATGHVRLGWSMSSSDIEAPVGYDAFGYGYRDLEGSKVHVGWRHPYGEAYGEGDTIGMYIHLPVGAQKAPQPPEVVSWKGQPFFVVETKESEKSVPGSEVVFFKNGVCQGSAFTFLTAGRYFPSASIYTMPEQTERATVTFNFGPHFKFPISDWGVTPEGTERRAGRAMVETVALTGLTSASASGGEEGGGRGESVSAAATAAEMDVEGGDGNRTPLGDVISPAGEVEAPSGGVEGVEDGREGGGREGCARIDQVGWVLPANGEVEAGSGVMTETADEDRQEGGGDGEEARGGLGAREGEGRTGVGGGEGGGEALVDGGVGMEVRDMGVKELVGEGEEEGGGGGGGGVETRRTFDLNVDATDEMV